MTTSSLPRNTRQRQAVMVLLNQLTEFRSAQDIHALLRSEGQTVGLTTVYRTLQSLADSRQVDVIRTDDGEARYRRCTPEHHHHLVCRSCGRTVEVDDPAVERWAEEVARRHNFTNISHTLEIYGTCAVCEELKTNVQGIAGSAPGSGRFGIAPP